MTQQRLASFVGLFLVISHFAILVLVIASPLYGLHAEQALELAMIIAPLFAAFSTVIIKHFIRNKAKTTDESPELSVPFVMLSFFLPLVFVIVIIGIFLGFALDIVAMTFTQTKTVIGSLEILFGVYVGMITDSLFQTDLPPKAEANNID